MAESSARVRYRYGDYVQWTGDERWELIDGEPFDMTPAPSRRHQELVGEIHRQLATQLLGRPGKVYVAPFDVRLPRGNEPDADVDTVVQPDLVVVCDSRKLDDAGCRGAPDWILEVLSLRTAARDRERKRDLYERAAVREYWHLHPDTRHLARYLLAEGRGYGEPMEGTAQGTTSLRALPPLEVHWDSVFP
jgi:Uma2 family endonuclease